MALPAPTPSPSRSRARTRAAPPPASSAFARFPQPAFEAWAPQLRQILVDALEPPLALPLPLSAAQKGKGPERASGEEEDRANGVQGLLSEETRRAVEEASRREEERNARIQQEREQEAYADALRRDESRAEDSGGNSLFGDEDEEDEAAQPDRRRGESREDEDGEHSEYEDEDPADRSQANGHAQYAEKRPRAIYQQYQAAQDLSGNDDEGDDAQSDDESDERQDELALPSPAPANRSRRRPAADVPLDEIYEVESSEDELDPADGESGRRVEYEDNVEGAESEEEEQEEEVEEPPRPRMFATRRPRAERDDSADQEEEVDYDDAGDGDDTDEEDSEQEVAEADGSGSEDEIQLVHSDFAPPQPASSDGDSEAEEQGEAPRVGSSRPSGLAVHGAGREGTEVNEVINFDSGDEDEQDSAEDDEVRSEEASREDDGEEDELEVDAEAPASSPFQIAADAPPADLDELALPAGSTEASDLAAVQVDWAMDPMLSDGAMQTPLSSIPWHLHEDLVMPVASSSGAAEGMPFSEMPSVENFMPDTGSTSEQAPFAALESLQHFAQAVMDSPYLPDVVAEQSGQDGPLDTTSIVSQADARGAPLRPVEEGQQEIRQGTSEDLVDMPGMVQQQSEFSGVEAVESSEPKVSVHGAFDSKDPAVASHQGFTEDATSVPAAETSQVKDTQRPIASNALQTQVAPQPEPTDGVARYSVIPDPAVARGPAGESDVLQEEQPDIATLRADAATSGPMDPPNPVGPGRTTVADQPELRQYDDEVSSDDSDEKSNNETAQLSDAVKAGSIGVGTGQENQIIGDRSSEAGSAAHPDTIDLEADEDDAAEDADSDDDSAESDSQDNLPAVEHHDGVNLMGEIQYGVGDDEKSAAEEDDDDSQRDEPLYDGGSDDSDSDEIVTYDEDLEATDKKHRLHSSQSPPTQSRAASEELEAEAETRSELEAEIRHHERRPIPHATLLEENEEFGNDGETPYLESRAFQLTAQYETITEDGDPEEPALEPLEAPAEGSQGLREADSQEVDLAEQPEAVLSKNLVSSGGQSLAEEDAHSDDPGDARARDDEVVDEDEKQHSDEPEAVSSAPSSGKQIAPGLSKSQRKRLRRKERKEDAIRAAKRAKRAFDIALRARRSTSEDGHQSDGEDGSEEASLDGTMEADGSVGVDNDDTDVADSPVSGSDALSEPDHPLVDNDVTTDETAGPGAQPIAVQERVDETSSPAAESQPGDTASPDQATSNEVYYTNVKHPGEWRKGMPIRFSDGPVRAALLDCDTTKEEAGRSSDIEDKQPIVDAEVDVDQPGADAALGPDEPRVAAAGDILGEEVDIFPSAQSEQDGQDPAQESLSAELPAVESEDVSVVSRADDVGEEVEDAQDGLKHGHHASQADEDVLALEPTVLARNRSRSPDAEHRQVFAEAISAVQDQDAAAVTPNLDEPEADVGEAGQEALQPTSEAVSVDGRDMHKSPGHDVALASPAREDGSEDPAHAADPVDLELDPAPVSADEAVLPTAPTIVEPVTPPRANTPHQQVVPPSPDPTRHYHSHHRRTPSVGASTGTPRSFETSPAHATRSQCRYHRITFVDGSDKPDILIPGCTIDYTKLQKMRAETLGEATKSDMTGAKKIMVEDEHIQNAAAEYAIPEKLIHDLRIMVSKKLFDEGHCFIVPGTSAAADSHLIDAVDQPTPTASPLKRKRETISPVPEADEQDQEAEPRHKRRVIEISEGQTVEEAAAQDEEPGAAAADSNKKAGGLFSSLWPSWLSRK